MKSLGKLLVEPTRFLAVSGFIFLPLAVPLPSQVQDWQALPRTASRGMPILTFGWHNGPRVLAQGLHSLN